MEGRVRCWSAVLASAVVLLLACGGDDAGKPGLGGSTASGGTGGSGGETQGGAPPTPYPLSDEVTIVPTHTRLSSADARNPSDVAALESMLDEGFGDFAMGPGEPHTVVSATGATPPPAGPNARLVARFVHMPDFQLVDDESPARVCFGDSDASGQVNGAFRPHEANLCHMVDALVRTVNRIHAATPVDFALLGGDNVDNAQQNELGWLLALLHGSTGVHCDSGADDDPIAGPGNDAKDPFDATGLAMPWYWVTGNHDIELQGNIYVDDPAIALATGTDAGGGTRDWSQPGGPLFTGPLVADEARILLYRRQMMETVAAHDDGHGLGNEQALSGVANYSFDLPGTPLRFVVLDTAAETGGASGLIRQAYVDDFVVPTLNDALSAGRWVVLVSHHATDLISDGDEIGGVPQDDAVLEPEWLDIVGAYPNVLFSMVAHAHKNRTRLIGPDGGHQWFEVQTAALADFPHQARVVEITDQDNGWVMLRATSFDFLQDDPIAEDGRRRGIADWVSAWGIDGLSEEGQRNVEVWIEAP